MGLGGGFGPGVPSHSLKAVLAIISGIAYPPITGSEDDIDHLSRGNKVYRFSTMFCAFDEVSQKGAQRLAEAHRLLFRVHAVAMQFDEEPVRATIDSDSSLLPERETPNRGWVRGSQRTVLNTKHAMRRMEIPEQWPLYHERKQARCATDGQIRPAAVRFSA